jgi:hypothetical protein
LAKPAIASFSERASLLAWRPTWTELWDPVWRDRSMGIGVANRAADIGSVSCAVLCGGKGTWGARARAPRHAPARSCREAGRGFARATSDFYSVASAGPRGLVRLGGGRGRARVVTLARPRRATRVISGPGGPALTGKSFLRPLQFWVRTEEIQEFVSPHVFLMWFRRKCHTRLPLLFYDLQIKLE